MPVPALACFVAWIAYGALLWRRSPRWRARVQSLSRTAKGVGGTGLLFLGAAVLLGGLASLAPLGLAREGKLEPGGWVLAGVVGLAFVHAQVVAVALMVALVQENADAARGSGPSK
ncbi:MAG: hypothetical protein KIS66_14810 [Fimbriimonadaceae bacterium]|nr:hypothetical protein [Fimbriimonadaceae bacterium]